MQLAYTPDEETIHDLFVGFFDRECPIEVVRAAEPLGFDANLWTKLCSTGAPSMALPEVAGGGGADLPALAIVVHELGRTLAPIPLIEHAVALRLAAAIDLESTTLTALIASERIATIGLNVAGDVARLAPAGAIAHLVLAQRGSDLVLAESEPAGSAPANTGSAPIADRSLADADIVATDTAATAAMQRARAEWLALTATQLSAMGRQALQLGIDYTLDRKQFDVAVGSFQAVQHGFADASVKIEGATLLAQRAVWALETDQPGAHDLAAMAHLFCADAAKFAAATSLQFHGGYGYAEEYDVQLYYRQAKTRALLAGSPGGRYQTLADSVLGPVATASEAS